MTVRTIILAVSCLYAAAGVCGEGRAVVTPGYSQTPAPAVMVDYNYLSHNADQWGWDLNHCDVRVKVSSQVPLAGVVRYHEYLLISDDTDPDYCWGVKRDKSVDPDIFFPAIAERLRGVPIPYWRSDTYLPGLEPIYQCDAFIISSSTKANPLRVTEAGPASSECKVMAAPVTCTVSVPDVLQHDATPVGGRNISTRGAVHVSCSDRATVTVSVLVPNVDLTGNGSSILSWLYVGIVGDTAKTLIADTTASVDLISVIDSVGDVAGEYQGSGLVVVNWD